MCNKHSIELTDTLAGEANYSWVRGGTVTMPELTHYGYTGSSDGSYSRANRIYQRELMRKAKAAVGLTGVRGRKEDYGDSFAFVPYKSALVMFVRYVED